MYYSHKKTHVLFSDWAIYKNAIKAENKSITTKCTPETRSIVIRPHKVVIVPTKEMLKIVLTKLLGTDIISLHL